VVWKFISSLYKSKWNSLIVDNNISFRKNVSEKFTSKTKEVNISKNKSGKSSDIPATINKISPSIPTKSLKEINKISKYFKKNQQSSGKKKTNKSYTQASTPTNPIREALKIKKTFSNLLIKKIKNIQKVINSGGKVKPKLHIMTKRPSQKQVIVFISNNNKSKFMMDLSSHITNINRALKNIKFDTKADFIQSE